ncbi:hypothetical protein E8E12_007648 [Didymella heteroderae]|uniref:Uncharacterized protein n=1 Tax=Didymella heteroderae TaxID=1769908 RepID=A0A9P5C199_9PLEO|nr:hypothetical protein E8E12_007648 [Didymella heteroderae]
MNIERTMPRNIERAMKAGRIAQSLFYAFLENTWSYDMRKVCIKRDQDHGLVAVEATDGIGVLGSPGRQNDCETYAGGWFTKFPVESFGKFDDDAKHALLTDRGSIWAFMVMHAAVQALFQDLVNDLQTDIKEVVHYPVEKASRIVHAQGVFGFGSRRHDQLYPDQDEQGDTKGVYEIMLKCGSRIVLDLASAQWDLQDGSGPQAPVTWWAEYWSRWGAAVKYRIPFRSHALKHAAKMESYRMITSQTLIMETNVYFNVFMTSACKAELNFHPNELLDMDRDSYRNAKQRFLTKATTYLQKRANELDSGEHRNILSAFDLRHPEIIAQEPKLRYYANGSLPPVVDMTKFDWKALSRHIQQPSSAVTLKEKKRAVALKKKRSVYKEPNSWQLVFLEDTLPGPKHPVDAQTFHANTVVEELVFHQNAQPELRLEPFQTYPPPQLGVIRPSNDSTLPNSGGKHLVREIGLATRLLHLHEHLFTKRIHDYDTFFKELKDMVHDVHRELIMPWSPLSDCFTVFEVEYEDLFQRDGVEDNIPSINEMEWRARNKSKAEKIGLMKVLKGNLAKEGNTLIDYIAQKLLEMLVELTGQKVVNFQDWWLLHRRRNFAEWRSLVSTDYSVNRFLYGNISHV